MKLGPPPVACMQWRMNGTYIWMAGCCGGAVGDVGGAVGCGRLVVVVVAPGVHVVALVGRSSIHHCHCNTPAYQEKNMWFAQSKVAVTHVGYQFISYELIEGTL